MAVQRHTYVFTPEGVAMPKLGVAADNGSGNLLLLDDKNSLTIPIMMCSQPDVANMPPTIPISLIRNWRSGFLFSIISTIMGDISYLTNMPGTPWLPSWCSTGLLRSVTEYWHVSNLWSTVLSLVGTTWR